MKKKTKKKMKKNVKNKVITCIILVLILILSLCVFIFYKINEKIGVLKDTFQFEYGEVVTLDGKSVLDTKDSSILETFEVDYSNLDIVKDEKYPEVGSYDIEINYKKNGETKKEKVKIIIEDTKKPVFKKIPKEIEIEKGYDSKNLTSYFEAKDLSPFEIKVDTKKLDTNKSGEYEIEVTAIDKYDNKTVEKVKVIVLEEEVKEPGESNGNEVNEKPSNGNDKPNKVTEKPSNDVAKEVTPYTVEGPRYVNGIIIVNKKNPVPYNYAPYENAEAGNQVRTLISDMQNSGYNISSSYSGFRSFDTQAGLYQNYVNGYGKSEADTFSARAGYSEHQTGLAFDLLHSDGTLVENSNEVNWISKNAHKYGFIVRYKAGKEHITGYQAEPWHIRYVGSNATDIYNSGLTLEEYLGVQGGGY